MSEEVGIIKHKIKIDIIDFIPEYGKHKTGIKDKNGEILCLGDTVEDYREEKHFVAYRYGKFCLKQSDTIHYLSLKDNEVTKLNIVTAASDYLIIGYSDEPLFEDLKEFLKE